MASNSDKLFKKMILSAMVIASGIAFLDSSAVNVALPSISRAFSTGLSGLQWVMDGYVWTLASLLMLGGSLGDHYGRRRVMLIGLTVFGFSSIACGLSLSMIWLVIARMFEGMGGALLIPGSLATLRAVYREREERGRAIGLWSAWSGISTIVGPVVGGWLVDSFSWRYVFFINVPIIIFDLWLILKFVPESRNAEATGIGDWPGASFAIVGLGGVVYGLIEGPVKGWESASVIAGLVLGTACLWAFAYVERKVTEPMLPPDLVRIRDFVGANIVTFGVYFALYGMTFILVIFLQNIMGYSALQSGLMIFPVSVILMALSPLFGKLSGVHRPRFFMSAGPIVSGIGLCLLIFLQPNSSFWTGLFPALILLGIGLAITLAPLSNIVISAVPEGNTALAAAFNNVISRIAALIAIAILGVVTTVGFNAVISKRTENLSLSPSVKAALENETKSPAGSINLSKFSTGVRKAFKESYTFAFHWAMLVTALAPIACGIVAYLVLRPNAPPWILKKH